LIGSIRSLKSDARARSRSYRAFTYVLATLIVAASALVAWFVFGEGHLTDVVMVFLLGIVVASMRLGYGPSLLATILSVVAFEYFFIPPLFSFAVSDLRHVVTFTVMFLVAIVISHQTKRIREQAEAATERERNTANLYAASREMGLAHSQDELLLTAAEYARTILASDIAVLLPSPGGELHPVTTRELIGPSTQETSAAQGIWRDADPAGPGGHPGRSEARMVKLPGSEGPVGVLVVRPREPAAGQGQAGYAQLLAFASLLGSALERTRLANEARLARLRVETEQVRNALLSSVSHDLKTPISVVMGATGALLERPPKDEDKRRVLVLTAHEGAVRLNRLLHNLLDMTRLEAQALTLRKEWQPLEEVVGAALNRLDDRMLDREVTTNVAPDFPLVPFDAMLIEQVLVNLLENAAKHTPPGSPMELTAVAMEGAVQIEVADRGPGVSPQDSERIFEKFYRVHEKEGGGVGLGLTICKGIVTAHGGQIWVDARPGGGALFRFTLPLVDVESHPEGLAAVAPVSKRSP
jgi:two-component system sensor histidine kinase KdpD